MKSWSLIFPSWTGSFYDGLLRVLIVEDSPDGTFLMLKELSIASPVTIS